MDILTITDLDLGFQTPSAGRLAVLRGVNLTIRADEVLALVGESGSGKSALGKSILQLHAPPFVPDRARLSGSIRFAGEELIGAAPERVRQLRRRDVGWISQDALSGLNPVMPVGAQIAEAAVAADPGLEPAIAAGKAAEMLAAVGLTDAGAPGAYPHQLSGGQRQRVMIAIAAVRQPRLLIADEPTTALDATVQARVLALLHGLQRQTRAAMLFITHDLGVVAHLADRVAVAYAGEIVEVAPVADLFCAPRHPYASGLVGALPNAPPGRVALRGHAPDLRALPPGCAFAPRCAFRTAVCTMPPPQRREGAATFRCWNPLP